MSYQAAATYLQADSVDIEEYQDSRQTQHVIQEHPAELGYKKVKAIFSFVVKERRLNQVYQAFQSQAIRDSMHIPWKIWAFLSKEIREEITSIKSNIKEEKGGNDRSRSDKPKPKPKDKVIPP